MAFADLVEDVDRAVQGNLGGVTVTYSPATGNGDPVEVVGMFDERYVLAEEGARAGIEQVELALALRVEDLPIHPDADDPVITIGAQNYEVSERRPDGMGMIVLILRREGY